MKYIHSILIIFCFALFSCATVSCAEENLPSNTLDEPKIKQLPRHSFLKIDRNITFKICKNEEDPTDCIRKKMRSSGSGFVIGNVPYGSFIMTAAHVCDVSDYIRYLSGPGVTAMGDEFFVTDVGDLKYSGVVLEMDLQSDLCVVFIHGLRNAPVTISSVGPSPGDRAYNLAAPVGFFSKGTIPTLDGYYNGQHQRYASYSVPAIGGSSGSPLFNAEGHLIGMIHSVHVRFQFLTFSPTLKEIREMAGKYINLETH